VQVVREVILENQYGLHARPAAEFVELANTFPCDVFIIRDSEEVNGKSIMGLMMLGAEKGTRLVIKAIGDGAEEAAARLVELVQNKFGEEEEG